MCCMYRPITKDHGRRQFDCSVIHSGNGARNLKLLPRRGFRVAPESSIYFHVEFNTLLYVRMRLTRTTQLLFLLLRSSGERSK